MFLFLSRPPLPYPEYIVSIWNKGHSPNLTVLHPMPDDLRGVLFADINGVGEQESTDIPHAPVILVLDAE